MRKEVIVWVYALEVGVTNTKDSEKLFEREISLKIDPGKKSLNEITDERTVTLSDKFAKLSTVLQMISSNEILTST